MTPLYLDGRSKISVSLDAPALAVEQLNKTRQLFPLSRISRIVVSGKVDWTMAALMACADDGISIVFLNRQGQPRCCFVGRSASRQSVAAQFLQLIQRPDALLQYQNWQRGMSRMVVRSTARRLGFNNWQLAEEVMLRQCLTEQMNSEWQTIESVLLGYLMSFCLGYLQDMGMSAESELLLNGQFNLAEDLAGLLLWDFYPILITWSKRSVCLSDRSKLVSYFEKRQKRMDHLIRGLLNRLHQSLLEDSTCR